MLEAKLCPKLMDRFFTCETFNYLVVLSEENQTYVFLPLIIILGLRQAGSFRDEAFEGKCICNWLCGLDEEERDLKLVGLI